MLKIALANLQTIVIVLRQWEALFKTEPLSNQSKSIKVSSWAIIQTLYRNLRLRVNISAQIKKYNEMWNSNSNLEMDP